MAEWVAQDWTVEEVDKLRDMWAKGHTVTVIAKALGRTRSAVCGKVFRSDLPKREPGRMAVNCPEAMPVKRVAPKRAKVAMGPLNRPSHPWKDSRPERAPDRSKIPPFRGQSLEGSNPKPFLERRFGECAWPIGEEGEDLSFCCLPISRGSYCRAHSSMAYVKPINPRHIAVVLK